MCFPWKVAEEVSARLTNVLWGMGRGRERVK
jgi:hypothetical protein